MKIDKFAFLTLAAVLLSHATMTLAAENAKEVTPSNPFVILLEGTY